MTLNQELLKRLTLLNRQIDKLLFGQKSLFEQLQAHHLSLTSLQRKASHLLQVKDNVEFMAKSVSLKSEKSRLSLD